MLKVLTKPDIPSPCVNACCLNDKDICVGCFRSLDEILSWSSMSLSQKQATLIKCHDRKQRKNNAKKDFDSR